MNNLIVVEFSISQKAFHKHSILEMLLRNNENILKRRQTDYLPITICKTDDEANKTIDKCYDQFKDYTFYKSTVGETLIPAN